MSTKLRLNQVLAQLTGGQERVEVSGDTVRRSLEDLTARFPATRNWLFDARGELVALVLINGMALPPADLDKAPGQDDEIYILTMIGGG